jgi:hypothetical protein
MLRKAALGTFAGLFAPAVLLVLFSQRAIRSRYGPVLRKWSDKVRMELDMWR